MLVSCHVILGNPYVELASFWYVIIPLIGVPENPTPPPGGCPIGSKLLGFFGMRSSFLTFTTTVEKVFFPHPVYPVCILGIFLPRKNRHWGAEGIFGYQKLANSTYLGGSEYL